MKLIDQAGLIFRKAWSVRLNLLVLLLSALEIGMPYVLPSWPPRVAAIAAFGVSLLANVARFIAQPKMQAEVYDASTNPTK